jgi:hypothetical protein
MDSRKRGVKGLRHFRETRRQSRPSPDEDIIMAGRHGAPGRRKPYGFTKTAANAVALDGAAGLPRHSETDAHRALISPVAPLHDKCPVCGSHAAGSGPEITPAP